MDQRDWLIFDELRRSEYDFMSQSQQAYKKTDAARVFRQRPR